ncbi:MAG TPA: hypothetical protein VF065_01005 [Ilumatobacter sp.]
MADETFAETVRRYLDPVLVPAGFEIGAVAGPDPSASNTHATVLYCAEYSDYASRFPDLVTDPDQVCVDLAISGSRIDGLSEVRLDDQSLSFIAPGDSAVETALRATDIELGMALLADVLSRLYS